MKTFFILLLLTNIVFAMMQWLFPYDQLFSHSRPLIAAEQLQLLNEEDVKAANPPGKEGAEKIPVIGAVPAQQKLCYTLGPFKEKQLVQEVMSKFRQNNIQLTSRPSIEKEYLGMMVYIDGHNSRKEVRATARSLAKKGIRDYMIVTEEDKSNALSLGVFGLKKNADRRAQQITALGYDIKSEPRYRNRTIYWLDYNNQENELLADMIDRLKLERGVSRISRLCN